LCEGLADSVISLALFEQAAEEGRRPRDSHAWERDADARRQREAELEAEDPRDFSAPDYFEWRTSLAARAARDVLHARWERGEWPETYRFRLAFIHARSFIHSLAQVRRALHAIADYDIGDEGRKTSVRSAIEGLDIALPGLKGIRDSNEHAEDRVRSRVRNQPLKLGPVVSAIVDAPRGGALVMNALYGHTFGCTIADGTFAEVDLTDATVEATRVAIQTVVDALPWKPGFKQVEPSA
jgi:hypothetical protein